jgi:hypothetical protein
LSLNNPFSLSFTYSFFLLTISFLWIGPQFPQNNFLSYCRIYTLHYYFLLICILFSFYFCYKLWIINYKLQPTLRINL